MKLERWAEDNSLCGDGAKRGTSLFIHFCMSARASARRLIKAGKCNKASVGLAKALLALAKGRVDFRRQMPESWCITLTLATHVEACVTQAS